MSARWPLVCFAAMGLFWGTWAAFLPDLKAQVGASDGELGLAMLAAGVGSLPAMVLTGRLWRRLGWWLVPATALIFAISTLGPILATDPVSLGVALFFVGASSGALDVAMNSAISDVEVSQDRRLMYGAHALFSLAVLAGSVATGLGRQAGVEPAVGLAMASAVFVAAAAGSLTVARRVEASHEQPVVVDGAPNRTGPAIAALATLAVLCALAFLIEDGLQSWSALLLEREIGASPAVGGAGPGIFAGAMFLGRSSGQWLGARFSDRLLLTGGALMATAGLVIAATANEAAIALVGLGLAGAGVALVAPALFARAGRLADPGNRGAAIATLTTFGYFGFVVGPVLIGLVAQAAGLRSSVLVMAGLALVLAVVGAAVLRPTSGRGSFAAGEELLRTGRG